MRRTRLQQQLSIRQLADLAKVSKTSVVQVESGRTSRRSTYVKIAEVLGLHLDNLLQTSTNEKPYAVHRRSDDVWFDLVDFASAPLPQKAQESADERVKLSRNGDVSPLNILQSRLEYGRIKPTIIEISGPSPARSHSGEEHVFVLSGSAVIQVGSDSIQLEEGESVTFWSAELHSYAPAEGSSLPVRLLSVRVDT